MKSRRVFLLVVKGEDKQVFDVFVAPPPRERELAEVEFFADSFVPHEQWKSCPRAFSITERPKIEHRGVDPTTLLTALAEETERERGVEMKELLRVL